MAPPCSFALTPRQDAYLAVGYGWNFQLKLGMKNLKCIGSLDRDHIQCDMNLTHWGRVTHICVSKLTIIGSDNGLSPGRRQAITWTNVGILLIGPLGTNFSEMLIEMHTFSFKKIHFKMSSGKWRPSCLGLNVLTGLPIKHDRPVVGRCFKSLTLFHEWYKHIAYLDQSAI